jgi:hypothetical protein
MAKTKRSECVSEAEKVLQQRISQCETDNQQRKMRIREIERELADHRSRVDVTAGHILALEDALALIKAARSSGGGI